MHRSRARELLQYLFSDWWLDRDATACQLDAHGAGPRQMHRRGDGGGGGGGDGGGSGGGDGGGGVHDCALL